METREARQNPDAGSQRKQAENKPDLFRALRRQPGQRQQGEHGEWRVRSIAAQLVFGSRIIHLALEPGPLVELAERLAMESQDRRRVVIREIGFYARPAAAEGSEQKAERSDGAGER